MYNKYEIHYSYRRMQKFYSSLYFTRFEKLDLERRDFLDALVKKNKLYFHMDTTDTASVATSTATKLVESSIKDAFLNDDEVIYFFIKMVDPEFRFLEVYESVMNIKEMQMTSILNFGYYDNVLIHLEKVYNKKFQVFGPDELWTRESIKRTRKLLD